MSNTRWGFGVPSVLRRDFSQDWCRTFVTQQISPSQRGEQILHRRIIPERAADMRIPVQIARLKHKLPPS